MERVWQLGPICEVLGITYKLANRQRQIGNLHSGGSLNNAAEIEGTARHIRFTFAGALHLGAGARLMKASLLSDDAFQIARRAVEFGTTPETWGDEPAQLKPWNHRAPGRIFAAGRTLLTVDPRRRDPLTGLAPHRVICTADPAFKKSETLLTAPDEGQVEGDPETVILIDLTALGHRLCAGLCVDPAEHLITPEPEGGWS